jgi:hypothetical protein
MAASSHTFPIHYSWIICPPEAVFESTVMYTINIYYMNNMELMNQAL